MILSIVTILIRFALLAVFTFAFVVLFEHGPNDFVESAKTEWQALTVAVEKLSGAKPVEPGA